MGKNHKILEEKKQDLVAQLVSARKKVIGEVLSLPENHLDDVFLGSWSVKELLAHLAGWDDTNREAVQEMLCGQYPDFFQYYDKDWHSYNERLVNQYRKETLTELLAQAEVSHERLIWYLNQVSAKDLMTATARSARGRIVTVRNLLISEANDERTHASQVAAYREQLAESV